MLPILATLAANGLELLGRAVLKKGQAVVEKKLGIDLAAEPTPENLVTWKQAELEHEQFLLGISVKEKELELEDEKLKHADRADARSLQAVALGQSDLFAKRFIYYYAWFWSVMSCAFLGGVTFLDLPPANHRVVDTILGFILGTLIASLIGFFYGAQHKVEKSLEAHK